MQILYIKICIYLPVFSSLHFSFHTEQTHRHTYMVVLLNSPRLHDAKTNCDPENFTS